MIDTLQKNKYSRIAGYRIKHRITANIGIGKFG